MARQIPSSPSNKRVSELFRRVKDGSLILQPEFQRKLVWNREHKEAFIDTILRGLPFPEIYIAQRGIDIERVMSTEVIVDGQQRLSCIVQYIDEKEASLDFGRSVPLFSKLLPVDQEDFLNYTVVVRDLGDIEGDTIKEVFRRINLTKFGLEQIEIQNAVYDGHFISAAKEILEILSQDHLPIFSDSELSRMADLHFVLLVMSTVENGGYFSFDKEIEKYIQMYNDDFPESGKLRDRVLKAFEIIKGMELPDDSIWYRKSNFFTLLVEVAKMKGQPSDLRRTLLKIEDEILKNKGMRKEDNEYATYYGYMYTGTNSRQARVVRSELFDKFLKRHGK